MVVRLDKEGNIVSQGEQLEIGGNEKYVPLCRAHFNKKKLGN
jgi:thymidine kinase